MLLILRWFKVLNFWSVFFDIWNICIFMSFSDWSCNKLLIVKFFFNIGYKKFWSFSFVRFFKVCNELNGGERMWFLLIIKCFRMVLSLENVCWFSLWILVLFRFIFFILSFWKVLVGMFEIWFRFVRLL